MSQPLPETSKHAVATGTAIGTLALAIYQPALVVAVLAGVFFGIGITGFDGSVRRITLAAGALPAGLLGAFASIGVVAGLFTIGGQTTAGGETAFAAALAVVAIVLGLGLVATTTKRLSEETIVKTANSTLTTSAVAVVAAAGVYIVTATSTPTVLVESLIDLTGSVTGALLATLVTGAITFAVAIWQIPQAAIASPRRREESSKTQRGVAVFVALIGLVGAVLVVGAEIAASTSADSSLISRGMIYPGLGLIVLSLIGIGFSQIVEWSWRRTGDDENAIVGVLVGSLCGLALVAGVTAVAVPQATGPQIAGLLFMTALGLLSIRVVLGHLHSMVTHRSVGVSTGITIALMTGAAIVAASAQESATVTNRAGIAVLLPIVAGVFTYNIGRYGQRLSTEIGPDGTTELPQFVRMAWVASIALLGAILVVVGLPVLKLFAPVFSVPAFAAAVSGLVVVILGARLLIRD